MWFGMIGLICQHCVPRHVFDKVNCCHYLSNNLAINIFNIYFSCLLILWFCLNVVKGLFCNLSGNNLPF